MNKKPSFFRQAAVLISRYFHIFINNKQNLIMMFVIPLLTILIVSYVATPDMFAYKTDEAETIAQDINDGYPVLLWELVIQADKDDDGNTEYIGDDIENDVKEWDGKKLDNLSNLGDFLPNSVTKANKEHYFVINEAKQLVFLTQLATDDDLKDYKKYLSYNYILQCDIDLKNKKISPIGNKDNAFTGTFNGNGHKIKNFKIESDKDNVGLFGYVKSDEGKEKEVKVKVNPQSSDETKMTFYHNGIVENLQVINAKLKTKGDNVGVIAGQISNTSRVHSVSIKDCEIDSDKGDCVGGIVGKVDSDNAQVYTCYSRESNIKAKGESIGGIVGDLGDGKLSAAYSTSSISTQDESKSGAIIGTINSTPEDNVLSLYYEGDKDADLKAISNEDYKKYDVKAMDEDHIKQCSSFLKTIEKPKTAYDIKHDDKDDEEKDEDEAIYGFKKDGQTATFYNTQVGIFMLVIVAIFVGVCNSIGEICKERNILKREYMTNLRLDSYVTSKLVVQGAVCAIQMIVVILVFSIFLFAKGKELPDSGVLLPTKMGLWVEYYISMFLLTFAADVMSLVISSIVKSASNANSLIPIVLIVQIVFCGVMFPLESIMDAMSNLMISKWGIRALAATTRLNDTLDIFLVKNPETQLSMGADMSMIDKIYNSEPGHLLMVWGVLIAFIAIFSIICRFVLVSVKNDRR